MDEFIEEMHIIITDQETGEQMELADFVEKFGPAQAAAMMGFEGNPALTALFAGYLEAEHHIKHLKSAYEQTTSALKKQLAGMSDEEFEELLALQQTPEAIEDLESLRDELLGGSTLENHLIH